MIRRNWIKALAFGLIAAVSGVGAQAASITDLYNTGVDASKNILPDGTADSHYTLTFAPSTSLTAYATAPYGGVWVTPPSGSKWIGPPPFYNVVNGVYTYETTFTLTNAVLSTVVISGQASSDDKIDDILVNGVSVGFSTPDQSYGTLHAFMISGAAFFKDGTNTLTFVTENTHGVVQGLLVSMSGTYTSTVPEPTSIAMLGLGVVGLAAGRRFRTRRAG
ncbi:PEP-CTERM sorting domain-containing protein [Paludisphaera rhizosphaerae]|uniref:PEP-CTERM sorting domain-containing protein n=1 Tax=Paludisphaera rhizosphaerae TaxID=2711216 RepID=UPI0013ED2839|nr:PEP-CTERM sorting domain-containing protein [Paludisphaera rhizosphaerae]